jgi:hypothetical protein
MIRFEELELQDEMVSGRDVLAIAGVIWTAVRIIVVFT